MEDKIKLILQYMRKEMELYREEAIQAGIDVNSPDYRRSLLTVMRLKSFIDYRNIRIEEAWYVKLNSGSVSRKISETLCEYDRERSRRHSLALTSMRSLNEFGEKFGLPRFYDGELLSSSEIDTYQNIPTRKEITNFFLKLINELDNTSIQRLNVYMQEVGIELDDKEISSFITELQSNVRKTDRDYGVEEPFLNDNDDIKVKDDKKFDEFGI